ncbi:antirestriction protein [Legionella sp.]|uniref:antirestriction protein n=1 Tax=Legionella sp. TaxID=459 RepID=UPI00321FE9AE
MNIISSRVSNKLRLDFLTKHFGFPLLSKVDHTVDSWMRALCEHYQSGPWYVHELSNDGFYLVPACEDQFLISIPTNGFLERVSADAAGIIATLFALNYLCSKSPSYIFYDNYYLLLDFAYEHKEAENIFAAID